MPQYQCFKPTREGADGRGMVHALDMAKGHNSMRGYMSKLISISTMLLGGALAELQAGPAGAASDRSNERSLTGTWEGRLQGIPAKIVFNADGAGVINGGK